MLPLGSDSNIDTSISCTKEQAVMKLLGWSQGIHTKKEFRLPAEGLWLDQLPFLSRHILNLGDQLKELHERALLEYQHAFPPEAGTVEFDLEKHFGAPGVMEKLTEKQEALEDVQALIHRAREYAMDIQEEIGKGKDSQLLTDTEAAQTNGVLHITLRSLEKWQKVFYAEKPDTKADSVVQHSAIGDPDLMAQLTRAIPENEKKIGKADISLYVTLGLAIEAIAEKLGPPYSDENELPVVAEIVNLIGSKYQSKDGESMIYGQGLEMIRKRLSLALKVKPKLPKQP